MPRKTQLYDGDCNKLPGYLRMTCCDCGLVHDFCFYTVDEKQQQQIYYEVYRNKKATAQTRRWLNKKSNEQRCQKTQKENVEAQNRETKEEESV